MNVNCRWQGVRQVKRAALHCDDFEEWGLRRSEDFDPVPGGGGERLLRFVFHSAKEGQEVSGPGSAPTAPSTHRPPSCRREMRAERPLWVPSHPGSRDAQSSSERLSRPQVTANIRAELSAQSLNQVN